MQVVNSNNALRGEYDFERQLWIFWWRKHLEQWHGWENIGGYMEIMSIWFGGDTKCLR